MRSDPGVEDGASLPGLVSVIIPAFNAQRFIREAVDSALAQTYPALEILVVDDGSTDDTGAILDSYGGCIRVLRHPNRGPALARNAAVAAAMGGYVAFLDADDRWHPEKIAEQVNRLQQERQCGLVHTSVEIIDSAGRFVNQRARSWHDQPVAGFCTKRLLAHNTIVMSSVLVRRAALPVGPFRPGIDGCEDWDLWLRLSLHWPVAYVDAALTAYRVHTSNVSSNVALMLRSSVEVLTGFLAVEGLPSDVRREANRALRLRRAELAHYEYENGSVATARAFFLKAGLLDAASLGRMAVTLLPGDQRQRSRRLRYWFARRALVPGLPPR